MRELLLLRHAKSSWEADEQVVPDHERDLAPRGRKAAPEMGRLMRREGLVPDLVLCSTATRTRRTWALVAKELGREGVPVRELRTLYLAPPGRMLELIRRQAPEVGRLLLVGHNPGMHGLALRLAGAGEPRLLETLRLKFPTGALARLGFAAATAGWDEVAEGQGELLGFWRPRERE